MGNIDWGKINSILGSKAVENVTGIAGAGISAYAGGKQNETNQRQQAAQFAAEMALRSGQNFEGNRQGAATAAANASPLGANEDFANRQALRLAVLSGLRQPSVTATDPGVRAATPQISGGFQLPPGGLSPQTLKHLSPEATAGAIAQRQQHITNIDPYAPGVNFERMGFGQPIAGQVQQETDSYQGGARGRFDANQASQQQQLQAALAQNYASANEPEKKKGGGFLGGLGKVLKIAAPIAGTFIGGPALGMAIGGLGSAAGSKLQGDSWGGALKSGVGGALAAGVGNAAIPGGASAGTKALSGVNGAAQWAKPTAPTGQSQWRPGGLPQQAPGIDPNILAAALRRGQFQR